MKLLRPKTTKGEWFVEMTDLTIRVKEWEKNNLMGDYKGCIIADLKPSLGITDADVANGSLNKDSFLSYLKGNGGRQHAFDEVLANANSICDVMNHVRGLSKKELPSEEPFKHQPDCGHDCQCV